MAQRGELFHNVKLKKPNTNAFDLSHQVLTTGNMGQLIPIMCQEVVPGDRFRVRSEIFCRMMPMLAPVMQRIDLYTHYFFVPNRLLWNISKQEDSWECFITGGKDGTKTPTPPIIELSQDFIDSLARGFGLDKNYQKFFAAGSLWDYLGLPTLSQEKFNQIEISSTDSSATGITWNNDRVLAFPFLAYQLIYDEYYRDQNYTEPILDSENMTGGIVGSSKFVKIAQVRKRSWKKDYFTSALPWAQRGEAVTFPLGDTASINGSFVIPSRSVDVDIRDVFGPVQLNQMTPPFNLQSGLSLSDVGYHGSLSLADSNFSQNASLRGSNMYDIEGDVTGSADLSLASAITVNMLREGLRLQEWLERNAVGGARYVEQIYAHFGVMVPDATMQRPIYLGGGKQTIRISEVLQSVDTEDYDSDGNVTGSPLGEMAGHGISVGRTQGFNGRQFLEHGYIIGILSVMPKASYMNGMSKMWTRFDKLDYYFPEFAHLGEQEVKIKELNFRFDKGKIEGASLPNRNDDTFGYQSRYAEYKYSEDRVSGEFRDTLKYWHLGREFDPMDQFDNNNSFLQVQPEETERIFAVNDSGATHKLLFQIFHDVQAIRPMPKFATPFI